MWKRLNNPKGARQQGISSPVETTHDEKAYVGSTGLGIDVSRTKSPPGKNMPPPRPPREDDMPKGLPRLPFEPAPPPVPEHRDSAFRPVSSIYSQPSPSQVTSRFPRTSYATPSTTYTEEVSPPSSPEFDSQKKSSQAQNSKDQEVSPIDEVPDISRLGMGRSSSRPGSSSKPPSSNIPVLRREKRRNQVAAAAANLVTRKEIGGENGKKTADVRWDPYSGEQTTSEKGKPQSVKPGQFTPPGLRSTRGQSGTALGNESGITAAPKNHTSFGERVRKLKGNNVPTERPEWKGATGRQTVVPPVADQMDIQPLNIPRKSSKRVASPHSGRSGSSTPVTVILSGETSPASAQPIDPTIRTVLSNSGRNSPRILASPTSITPEPVAPNAAAAKTQNRGNTLPSDLPSHEKKDSTGTIERNFREALKDVSFAAGDPSDPYVQPPSRFSVTTYAPSEAHSTPRPSTDTYDRPPMPTPPQTYTTPQQPSPVINRKRPKVGESPKATTRKAVNPSSPVFISMSSSLASKRASNVGKNLPQSPAEAQSHDLVTSLQAQLDNLAHRRQNITKSIRQMTELMPTDSVVANEEVRRKREEEKRKVEMLRVEEADVRREEHEIGLRLHRAWKRRDKDAVYEPTGLWVRRVTG